MSVDQSVVRDVVVVIPGIMGSTLVDARRRPVWSVGAGGLVNAIRTFGGSLRSLRLPPDIGDEHPHDGVEAVDLIPGLHVIPGIWSPVAGYAQILAFLRGRRFHLIEADHRDPGRVPNLITFPYDWRLSNRHNARLLAAKAGDALTRWRAQPGMAEAKLVIVAHSMGGLVARWFVEREQGAELTRALITIGTPHRGSVKSLESLANGVEPGIGALRLRLTEMVRSMPSMYQLLPTYPCLQQVGGGRIALGPETTAGLDQAMLADATAFHAALDAAERPGYVLHKVVGIRQPTLTTARLDGAKVVASCEIDGQDQGGDGTVPRLAAEPKRGRGTEVHEVADQHGELQGTRSALDLLDGVITREDVVWEGTAPDAFGVAMSEVWALGRPPELVVPDLGDRRLFVTVRDERGSQVGAPVRVRPDGRALLDPPAEGGYEATVSSPVPGGPPPVTRPFLVWDPRTPSWIFRGERHAGGGDRQRRLRGPDQARAGRSGHHAPYRSVEGPPRLRRGDPR